MSKQTKARTGECVGFVVVEFVDGVWECPEPHAIAMPRADARAERRDLEAMASGEFRIARVVLDK